MFDSFTSDLHKYKRYSNKSYLNLFFTHQGLWAILVYRMNNRIYRARIPKFLKNIFLLFGVVFQKFIEIITGISIPYSVTIGKEFYIGHFGGVIINSKVRIGNNCNLSHGVTIGVSGRGDKRGVPVIGNNVYIGVNAVVVGNIEVGDNVVIGANSLVTSTVAPNCTVLGVPAKVISSNTSVDYI